MSSTPPDSNSMRHFVRQYRRALKQHLATDASQPSEEEFEKAHILGQRFLSSGGGLIELSTLHGEVLENLENAKDAVTDRDFWARRSVEFLTEALSPFEMAYRGYEEANEKLRDLNNSLEEHVEDRSQQLVESQLEYQRLLERLPGVFYTLEFDPDPRLTFISPQVESLLGHPASEWTHDRWRQAIHGDDRHRIEKSWQRAAETGDSYANEYRIRTAEGSTIWVRDEGAYLEYSGEQSGKLYGVAVDITEKRQLEKQFIRSQKMDIVGRLAGGVAHDFKNLLAVIMSFAQFLERELPAGSRHVDDAQEIIGAAKQADALARQLLGFSRQDAPKRQHIDLTEAIRTFRPTVKRLIPAKTSLHFDLSPTPLYVEADEKHIEQVLLNLVLNARKATGDGDQVTVGTDTISSSDLDLRPSIEDEKTLTRLYVRDTGIGMEPQTLEKIFEPFYTTDSDELGTGLGLSTSRQLIRDNAGDIIVDSVLGQGSCFSVLLPPSSEHTDATGPSPTPPSPGAPPLEPLCEASILVVDDEPGVLRMLLRFFDTSRVTVHTAESAAEARQIAAHKDLDVLLTDVVLPGDTGFELAGELVDSNPDLQVIFMSGYPDEALRKYKGHRKTSSDQIIEKPFDPEQLTERILRVCGDDGDS